MLLNPTYINTRLPRGWGLGFRLTDTDMVAANHSDIAKLTILHFKQKLISSNNNNKCQENSYDLLTSTAPPCFRLNQCEEIQYLHFPKALVYEKRSSSQELHRNGTRNNEKKFCYSGPGARFSKDPITLRIR